MEKEVRTIKKRPSEDQIKEEINYRLLYEFSGSLNCFFDRNCKLILFNKQFKEIFGNHIDFLKSHNGTIQHLNYFSILKQRVFKGIETGKTFTYETHYILDGRDVWLEGCYIPVKNINEEILGVQIISRDITKQKVAENNLKKNEDFLKKAQQLGQFGSWEWDLKSNIVHWSEETYKIFEMSEKENLTFEDIIKRFHKEDVKILYDEIEQSKISKDPFSCEARIIANNGKLKYVYLNVEPLFGQNNRMLRIFGTVQDITDRIEAQHKIIESENRYRILFEMLSDPTFLIDKETGNIIEINSAVTKTYGYSRDEALQMRNTDFSAEPDATRKALREKAEKVLLRWHKKKEGTVFPVEITGSNFNWNGDDVQIAVCRDITERVEAEKSLHDFERIFKLSANLICIVDIKGNFIKFNPAFENKLGFTRDEIERKKFFDFIHPEDLDKTLNYISGKIDENADVLSVENRYICKDGSYIWLSWKTQPIYEENISISVAHDITHLKKVEKELIISKEKAEESDRLKTAFLCNMSHEIRTPMNGIVGFTEMLSQDDLPKNKRLHFAEIITGSCKRLLHIINDIIDISKIETGQIDYHIEKVQVHQLINEVYNFYVPQAKKRNIKLIMEIPDNHEKYFIKTDHFRIRQVLDNLINNALKFTFKGHIKFGFIEENGFIKFIVQDTGAGIEPFYQKTIFERFIRADANEIRKQSGTGLGLPISKAIIEHLGGNLWMESVVGKGSVFYFTLPVR